MTVKNIINLIELEKAFTYLLESLADILAAGGSSFLPAHDCLRKLVKSGKVMDTDALKRCAFNLSNAADEVGLGAKSGSVEVRNDRAPTPRPATATATAKAQSLDEAVAELLIAVVGHVTSLCPGRHDEAAKKLLELIKAGGRLAAVIKGLLDLIIRIREELWAERSRTYQQIGDILKNVESAEKAFLGLVSAGEDHLTQTDGQFTEALESGLQEIGVMVETGQGDLEQLCRRISVKLARLNECVRRKKEADRAHLNTLAEEKRNAEQRLEQSKRDYDEFSRQSREMFQEIENLRAVSLRDPLTGVYNRRAYDNQIVKTLEAVRSQMLKTCGLVVFDIDHFREFNNTYGHLAGDRVLAYVARLTCETLRSDDLVFRYGGDEFVIVMPNADLATTASVAEKVRRAISSVEFKLFKNNDLTVAVTVSMGVAEIKPADDAAAFFARADQALYQAKKSGRNQVGACG